MNRREFLKIGFSNKNVCEAEPLNSREPKEGVKIGFAEIDKKKCSAWSGGGDCRMCYIKCPLMDEAIVLDDFKPVVVRENCDGCGICEDMCAMINGKAFIKVIPA